MNTKKLVSFCLPLIFSIVFVSPSSVKAALVDINNEGKLTVNVLSAENSIALGIPKRESLEVSGQNVELLKDGNSFKLALDNTNLDITTYKDTIVEIEETPQKKKLKISLSGDKFKIEQAGISVLTSFPIEIDPSTKQISVKTESGVKYLSVLPNEASEGILRSKIIHTVNSSDNSLTEENGVLVYKINGSKDINLFNVSKYTSQIETHVNASNGEIVFTNEPIWVKLLSLFLS